MKTKIMGIINVTPDSFSDGGDNVIIENIVEKVGNWLSLGIDIIDIGGESTRPGSDFISESEELSRVLPAIEAIISKYPDAFISIDTMKYKVAEQALLAGAKMINDISGLTANPDIAELAAKHNAELAIMHLPAPPKVMQDSPKYNNLIEDIFEFLRRQIDFAKSHGVKTIYADVGIGFGKTYEDNWELLRNIDRFRKLNVLLMLGVSRKRFIGEFLNIKEPKNRDFATNIIHALLYEKQIEVIRVHNVERAIEMRKIAEHLQNVSPYQT